MLVRSFSMSKAIVFYLRLVRFAVRLLEILGRCVYSS